MTGINGFNGNDYTRKNTGINNNGGVGRHDNAIAPEKEAAFEIKYQGNYGRDLLGPENFDYRSLLGFTPSTNNDFAALNAKYPNLQNYLSVSPEVRGRIGETATNTYAMLDEIGDFT